MTAVIGTAMAKRTTMSQDDKLGFAIFGADYQSDDGHTYADYLAWLEGDER